MLRADFERLTRLARAKEGAAMVEFALVAPVVMAMLIALLQLGVLGMMSANFQGATDSISRRIRTGQADRPQTAAEFRNMICARMVDTPANCQSRVKVTVEPVGSFTGAQTAIQAQNPASLTGGQAFDPGQDLDTMLVTATYSWPLALPFVSNAYVRDGAWNVLIVSRIVFRNEPWD